MTIFCATLGSFNSISFLSLSQSQKQPNISSSSIVNPFNLPHKLPLFHFHPRYRHNHHHHHKTSKISVSSSNINSNSNSNTNIDELDSGLLLQSPPPAPDTEKPLRADRRPLDWKAANEYRDRGLIYNGRVERINNGGIKLRFYSLMGFLPFSEMSPMHSCKEPDKTIQEIGNDLIGSILSVKVIKVDEEKDNLVFSEKEVSWFKYSKHVNRGDIFVARVHNVQDYGAYVHLRFTDGLYHLTGLIHRSEVSWDLVQDARDFLTKGEEVRVKVTNIDHIKSRITLSIKQLEEDPLLETLDNVIPKDGSVASDSFSGSSNSGIAPLPGLETILEELLQEDGIYDARISRQGFEKRVVSQDLQLWLSNAPPMDQTFTLLARAGRQVQEIQLKTPLDQEGIKKAIQRVLERVP